MKRQLPDMESLSEWAADHLEPGERHSARGLWLHWQAWAEGCQAEPGSPASFRNELRKMGYPVVHEPGRRKRYHQGVALKWPRLPRGVPLAQAIPLIDAILFYER